MSYRTSLRMTKRCELTSRTGVRGISRRQENGSAFPLFFKPIKFLLIYSQWLEIYEDLSIELLVSLSP